MIIGKAPAEFMEPLQKALEFYPELKDKKILVHETRFLGVQHTSRAYPPAINFFSRRANWIYTVAINRRELTNDFFNSFDEEQKIGLFAHELSHISYYSRLSHFSLITFSLAYAFSKRFARKIERETDFYAISRGAGKYLFSERAAFCNFVSLHPNSEIEDTYVHPKELLAEMDRNGNRYSQEDKQVCQSILGELKREPIKSDRYLSGISPKRKLKHALRIFSALFPELAKLSRAVKEGKKMV